MGCAASVELQRQLWAAVSASDAAACRTALSAGACPDLRNEEGETALHLGVRSFNSEVFRQLLEASQDHEAKDAHGQTPLHRAVLSTPEAAALLMVHGADVHATTPAGESPLTLAASVAEARGFSSVCVRMLLQRGADPRHRTVRGSTALHAAAARCAPDAVRLLAEAGAPAGAADRDGNTPLHLLAGAVDTAGGNEARGLQALRLLLLAGGDPSQRNLLGATPCAYASNPAAAEMLERALSGALPAPLSRSSIRDMRGPLPSWTKAYPGSRPSTDGTPGPSLKDYVCALHPSGTTAVAAVIANGSADLAVATPKNSSEQPLSGSSGVRRADLRGRSSTSSSRSLPAEEAEPMEGVDEGEPGAPQQPLCLPSACSSAPVSSGHVVVAAIAT